MLKLTPAGVNTGPISNGVNLTPLWCYFNTFQCFSSPIGVISTPKSVEITPLEIGTVLTPAGVNLTPEFLQCTLRMDVMSLRILCEAGLKRAR